MTFILPKKASERIILCRIYSSVKRCSIAMNGWAIWVASGEASWRCDIPFYQDLLEAREACTFISIDLDSRFCCCSFGNGFPMSFSQLGAFQKSPIKQINDGRKVVADEPWYYQCIVCCCCCSTTTTKRLSSSAEMRFWAWFVALQLEMARGSS